MCGNSGSPEHVKLLTRSVELFDRPAPNGRRREQKRHVSGPQLHVFWGNPEFRGKSENSLVFELRIFPQTSYSRIFQKARCWPQACHALPSGALRMPDGRPTTHFGPTTTFVWGIRNVFVFLTKAFPHHKHKTQNREAPGKAARPRNRKTTLSFWKRPCSGQARHNVRTAFL